MSQIILSVFSSLFDPGGVRPAVTSSAIPIDTDARKPPFIVAPLLFGGAAAIVLIVHLSTNAILGFHTDEFYYIDSGRHAALGYVDFPPIVPLLARLETDLLGATPWNLRLLPTLLGAFMVALSGAYVRRLGGSLRQQALGLLIAVTAPYFLGANWVYQTVTFDEATWMVALYWFLCLVRERRPKYWIYLGISLGIGLGVAVSQHRVATHRDRVPSPSCPFHVPGQVLLCSGYGADRPCSGAHGRRRRQATEATHGFRDRSRSCLRAAAADVCSADASHHAAGPDSLARPRHQERAFRGQRGMGGRRAPGRIDIRQSSKL